jgi:acetoacetyl-CoA synthetase
VKPLWIPSPARVRASAMHAFREAAAARFGLDLPDYRALHAWSVQQPAAFWAFYAEWAGLGLDKPERVMSSDPMPHTRWFEGTRLNYAQKLLYPPGLPSPEQAAVIAVTETGHEQTLSYADLRALVARAQRSMQRAGVGEGDRVAAYACNLPEALAAMLAAASLGAIFASCSPDFGLEAATARFAQVSPKLLFGSPVYRYGGKRFETVSTLERLRAELPGLSGAVLLPYPGEATPDAQGFERWEDWLGPPNGEPEFRPLPFDHPLWILFSSGTTGLPKAIVHRAGGALLKLHAEHRLHSDIRPGDRVFYFTTCGWMMWNWLATALAQAATIVQFEGSPAHPDLGVLWDLAERHDVSFFGTSARYLHSLQGEGFEPKAGRELPKLKTVASTGSPLSPAGFRYVYDAIKEDVHLASISGGTDIVSCFMGGVPTEPVYEGQIQGPALGVDLDALDEHGRPVRGEPGELVCRTPLPSMPLKFWNDPDFARYRDAYFGVYPGIWRHGDLIALTPEGGVVVYGRSDATLNPGGVRIGTAELYRPLEHLPDILEAVAVGKREGGDESIWLFVVLKEGAALTPELERQIRREIRTHASPRHVPSRILQVSQLPRTRSGKAMELAVSRLVNAGSVPNREVMANPEALDEIARLIGG